MKKTLYSLLFVLSASFLCSQEPVTSFDAFGQSLRRLMENDQFYVDVKEQIAEYVRGRNFTVDEYNEINGLIKTMRSHDDLLQQFINLGMEAAVVLGGAVKGMQNIEEQKKDKMKTMPELSKVLPLADQARVQQMINQGTTSVTINVDKTVQEIEELNKWERAENEKFGARAQEEALQKKAEMLRTPENQQAAEQWFMSTHQLFNKVFGQVRIVGENWPTILPATISGVGNALLGRTPSYLGLAMLRNFDYAKDLEQRLLRLASKYKDTLALTQAGRQQLSAFLYMLSSLYTPWKEYQSAHGDYYYKRIERLRGMPGYDEVGLIRFLTQGGWGSSNMQGIVTINLKDLLNIYKQRGEAQSSIDKRRMQQAQALLNFTSSLPQVFGSVQMLSNNVIKLYNAVLDGIVQGTGIQILRRK